MESYIFRIASTPFPSNFTASLSSAPANALPDISDVDLIPKYQCLVGCLLYLAIATLMSGPAPYIWISHFYDFLRTTNVYGSILSLSAMLITHPLGITLHLSPPDLLCVRLPLPITAPTHTPSLVNIFEFYKFYSDLAPFLQPPVMIFPYLEHPLLLC
jgi:hypothetical protein